MYFMVENSGCSVYKGMVQVRYCLYLEPGDVGYEKQHVQVLVIPEGGYPGKLDKRRSPVDMVDYEKWFSELPRVWRDNPFHNHFVQFDYTVTDEVIHFVGQLALQMAYEKWAKNEDIDIKNLPFEFPKQVTTERQAQCESRIASINAISIGGRIDDSKNINFPLHNDLKGASNTILKGNGYSLSEADVRKALFHDGIFYSVEIVRRIYKDLVDRCFTLGQFKFDNPIDLGSRAVADAWSIIDSLYRIRRLLEDMPNLKQKSPELQLFYRKTDCLKSLRDSIQHLDDQISKYATDKTPAWGRLSWAYPINEYRYKVCMIAPGDVQPDLKLCPSHYGKKMRRPIDFITLTGKEEACLTDMVDALEKLVPWLNTMLEQNFVRQHQFVVVGYGITAGYNILEGVAFLP
jgi:hypothetical protein